MLDSSLEQTPDKIGEPQEIRDLHRRRRKRHRARRQKRVERFWKKALIAFLYVLTISLVLAIWYALLKS
jgi:hypothetical protein